MISLAFQSSADRGDPKRRGQWLLVALMALVTLAGCDWGGSHRSTPGATAPSGLSYPSAPTYTVGTAIAALNPTVTGTVSSYSVSPALPDGLSLNTTSGQISGTPTVAAAQASYTVSATNSAGSTTAALSITVNPAAPSGLSYTSPQNLIVGTAIAALNPTVTGTVAGYGVSPALPAGLSLDSTTGQITGTPTAASAQASYTVTATNAGGSTTFALDITVSAPLPAPAALSYPSPQTFTVSTAIAPLNPTVTGTVASYSVNPALPAGLSLNATTGQITGTPTAATANATYTVFASNASGSASFGLSLTVIAGGAFWRTPAALQTNATSDASAPKVGADAGGNAVAVWRERSATGYSLWSSRYTPASGWSTAAALRGEDGSFQVSEPELAVSPQGTALVIWTDSLTVKASTYTPGAGWGTPAILDTNAFLPTIAVNASGTAVAIWGHDGTPQTLVSRTFTLGGAWSGISQVDSGTYDYSVPIAIAINNYGDATAAWYTRSGPATIMGAHLSATTGWAAATGLSSGSGHTAPSVAMDSTGNALVGWAQLDVPSRSFLILTSRYSPATGWAVGTGFTSLTNNYIPPPSVAIDSTGLNVVAWKDVTVLASTYLTGGSRATAIIDGSYADGPRLATDVNGVTTAIWEIAVPPAGTSYKLRTSRFSGSSWSTAVDVQSTTSQVVNDYRIAMSANGTSFATWSQDVGGHLLVWANVYR